MDADKVDSTRFVEDRIPRPTPRRRPPIDLKYLYLGFSFLQVSHIFLFTMNDEFKSYLNFFNWCRISILLSNFGCLFTFCYSDILLMLAVKNLNKNQKFFYDRKLTFQKTTFKINHCENWKKTHNSAILLSDWECHHTFFK